MKKVGLECVLKTWSYRYSEGALNLVCGMIRSDTIKDHANTIFSFCSV